MSKLSKTFFVLIVLVLLGVTGHRYYEYVYQKNFLLDVNTTCDPKINNCFIFNCESGPDCSNMPYKKIEIIAKDAPKCLEEHTCENFSCGGIENCSVTYCSDNILSDGELCTKINTNENVQ
jgi:hypothetical protein